MASRKRTDVKVKGVFEKEPGVWYIRYADASGKIRREKAGAKNVAVKLVDKRRSEILQGKKLPESLRQRAVTFSELSKDALEYSKMHKRSHRDDIHRMKKLTGWIGDRAAQSVTPQEIERWLSVQTKAATKTTAKKALMPATLNRFRALLSLTYRLGMQNGKVITNPARMVRQRRENNARERYLLAEEETRLRTAIETRWPERIPELDIALNTGMRRGEQYGAEWDWVDFENRILTVPRSKHGDKRHVYLNDAALSALRVLWQFSKGAGKVFAHLYDSEHSKGARAWFEMARADAKLENFRWHDLRHTYGSRLVMAGVDIRTVQELMGHKTIGVTVRYAHLAPKHQLAAVQRLCNTDAVQKEPTDPRTDTSDSSGSTKEVVTTQ